MSKRKPLAEQSFNEQAAFLIEDASDLIKQVLTKHAKAVLEEMHDQIVTRNKRIAELEEQHLRDCQRIIELEIRVGECLKFDDLR